MKFSDFVERQAVTAALKADMVELVEVIGPVADAQTVEPPLEKAG